MMKNRRTSVVLTISDVFGSLQSRSRLDTPTLRSEVTQRRSGRIVYLGITQSRALKPRLGRKDAVRREPLIPTAG